MKVLQCEGVNYTIKEVIGTGATSDVYHAIGNGKSIAVKCIDFEQTEIEIDNLRAEIALWSSCDHPNVVKYYGSLIDRSMLYFFMEYMECGSVHDLLRFAFQKGISEPFIATILYEVLKPVAYLHQSGQMHRDLKPGNILLNSKGEVKIGDFGIAASLLEKGQRKRARYTTVGTPCYMAPEVLTPSAGYAEKADIWSLGITAIELATGSSPYSNLRALEVVVRIANSPPPSLPEDGRHSAAFRDFVRSCLQVQPAKRPSAAELLESKFFRQRQPAAELAEKLLRTLPPLGQRFKLLREEGLGGATRGGTKPATVWDFDGLDGEAEKPAASPPPPSPPPEEPPAKVAEEAPPPPAEAAGKRKIGRFTISPGGDAKPPSRAATLPAEGKPPSRVVQLEAEVADLTARVELIAAENNRLREQMNQLENQLVKLRQGADKPG
jgi:serine/threonine-protein kinase OSR1/STK39